MPATEAQRALRCGLQESTQTGSRACPGTLAAMGEVGRGTAKPENAAARSENAPKALPNAKCILFQHLLIMYEPHS